MPGSSFWSGALRPSLALVASLRPDRGPVSAQPREMYEIYDDYYRNNALYESLHARAVAAQIIDPSVLGLRNPTHRVVEFYATKIWPGTLPDSLPLTAANPAILDPIRRVWKWSNWTTEKTVWAREGARYGDAFLKVSTANGPPTEELPSGPARRVYLQRIDPKLVTDFAKDERKNLIYLRMDKQMPLPLDANGQPQVAGPISYRTEIWNKAFMAVWTHQRGAFATPEQLGTPDPGYPIPLADWGIDFVPFVHAQFIDVGEERGMNAFEHALDKIDDVDRAATRLNQQLYRHNDNTWVLTASGLDSARRPMPQLTFGTKKDATYPFPVYTVAGTRLWSLPGNYALDSLVPNIDYNGSLAVLKDAVAELEADLPEMGYYHAHDFGTNISAVSLTLMLGAAVDRVLESRGNMEDALIRAQQMALTIGKSLGIDGFAGIGDYESGDLDHQFNDRPVIPVTQIEMLAAAAQKVALGVPKKVVLVEMGYNAEEVDQWLLDAEAQRQADMAAQQQALIAASGGSGDTQGPGASALVNDTLKRATQPGRTQPTPNGAVATTPGG